MRRFWPIVYLALLPLIPLWAVVFGGNAIGPFDQIRHMAPWNGPAPDQPWDVLSADGALQFYGWRNMVLDAWHKGQGPYWNSYELAGTPLLANSQSGGFYPPLVILGKMGMPTAPTISFLAWLHLALAGVGACLLSRSLGARKGPAAMAGAGFELSAFMLAWVGLSSVVYTCCWIPWMLFALRQVVTGSKPVRAAAGLAAATGMMLLAGHLQFAAFGLLAALIGWLVLLAEKRFALSLLAAAAMLVGIGASAHQLLPVLKFSQFSHRRSAATAEGYASYAGAAIQPFELANLIVPTALGNPRVWSSLDSPHISTYWPLLAKRGANLMEGAVTIGPLALVALFLVDWKDRRAWYIGGVGAIGLLIAMGSPLDAALYFGAPGWSATGSPGRAIVLFVLAAPILAALALSREKLPSWIDAAKFDLKLALAFLATLATFGLAQLAPLPDQVKFMVSEAARQAYPFAGIALLVGGAAIYFRKRLPELQALVPLSVALPVLATIVQTGKPLDPPAGLRPSYERVAIENDHWSLATIPHALYPPNTAGLFGIHELGGYDSLLHRDTVALLASIDAGKTSPDENGNMMFVRTTASPAALADAGATQVWSLGPDGLDMRAIPGTGRVSSQGGPASIIDEGYDHITLSANGPGRLTLRDRNMPGWQAFIEDKEVPISGTMWREVVLVPGPQTVTFRYLPPGLAEGSKIAFGSVVVIIVTLLLGLKPRFADQI